MKFSKKFMVVPYVEENEKEIKQRKIDNESKELTNIIQSNDITENDKYREYNEAPKKILFKLTDNSKENLELKNNNNEESNIINELIRESDKTEKRETKKSKIKKDNSTQRIPKEKIKKKSSKKNIDKLFKKFDELDKTSKKIEKKIKQTELNSSLFIDSKKSTQPTTSSTLKKNRLDGIQFSTLNMSPIVEKTKEKKMLNKRFSEKLDPIEQLSNHLDTSYFNKNDESLITDDDEEKTRKKSNIALIKNAEEEKRRKKENKMITLDKYRGINNDTDSKNTVAWTHLK